MTTSAQSPSRTSQPMAVRPALTPDRTPRWDVGSNGWDTHAHIFGPPERYPLREDRRYTPPAQNTDMYLAMLDAVGIQYGVLVQPSIYGRDNSCLLDALDAVPDRFVGVVDVDVFGAGDRQLSDMTKRGVRGLRVFWTPGSSVSDLRSIAIHLRDLGWHLDLHVDDIEVLSELYGPVASLGIPVMVEAMGSPSSDDPGGSPGFAALLTLLRNSDTWVKLSHAYHIDTNGPPYPRSARFARALLEAVPDRTVWGSDWPHPMGSGVMPSDIDLVDVLLDWAGDRELASRTMSDNPSRFYGYPGRKV